MHYIISLLAAIAMGTALGAMLEMRSTAMKVGAIIAIVLGIVTIVTLKWLPLAASAIVLGIAVLMHREPSLARG